MRARLRLANGPGFRLIFAVVSPRCAWLISRRLVWAVVLTSAAPSAKAAENTAWGNWPAWGDQGDGTYRNPVLPADYSDIDCIRVGSDYYAISSTFQFSPGMVILHSRDLVNWTLQGHVIADLTEIGPDLDWSRMNRYGRGVWAGSIRYHGGRFWVYFGTPDEGYFMSTAADPAGPWKPLHAVLKGPGWDDCCPFWDDDGQGYLVGTHFSDGYKITLFKLTPDGREVVPESGRVINQGSGREANKLFKLNGTYYHLYSEHDAGEGRYLMMERSKNLYGPYTETKQLNHADRAAHEPNQGGLVQAADGAWYFFTHHGTGSWEGRCDSLLPVTWTAGWPIIGSLGADGIGHMVWSGTMPLAGTPILAPQTDDEFSARSLPPQWEWNYQPRADKWSLTERPGYLRLHAFKPIRPGDLRSAGNTLTQRSMRSDENSATAALDLRGLAEGQVAGLCHFSATSSTLAIRRAGGANALEFTRNREITTGPQISSPQIWLRSQWRLDGRSQYFYSVDGTNFQPFGEIYPLAWGNYRGDRIGIFTFNDAGEAGYVDVDWFHYRFAGPGPAPAR